MGVANSVSRTVAPVILVANKDIAYSETFIHNHISCLHASVVGLNGFMPLKSSGKGGVLRRLISRVRVALNILLLRTVLLRKEGSILVEYGTTAAKALPSLEKLDRKVIVHFHGHDAHRKTVLKKYAQAYHDIFHCASAIVAVSHAMESALIELGAPKEKVHYIVCGIDPALFIKTNVSLNQAVFFACGRFVDKKAPHLTIKAFHRAWSINPDIRLRMAGDGPLWDQCDELIKHLGMEHVVTLMGSITPEAVADELASCRAFLQHSVIAPDGDSEGTPVVILEAMCSAVPVIATRHAGIKDIVKEGESGILVDEYDVEAMADAILRLAEDNIEAARLGEHGHEEVVRNYTLDASIAKLKALL